VRLGLTDETAHLTPLIDDEAPRLPDDRPKVRSVSLRNEPDRT
jgi:hypothetical protein